MIRVENLSKSFGQQQALDAVSLEFASGEIHGVVGENGAGKTTLFKCISGLLDYSGTLTSDLGLLKNHVGLLLAEPFFFPKITGREYLQLLANARQVKLENPDERNVFDLPLDQYAAAYSTGMKKKLALSAILLQNNTVFILDEPFSGVDIESNMVIVEIIKKLKALGKTIIISSHTFSTLASVCDHISLMRKGQVVKSVPQHAFAALEAEMKAFTVGDRVERLNLQ